MAMSIAHLSIPSRDQPYSIAELAKISEPTSYDSNRSIKDQLRAVETLRKQGQQHRGEADYQSAFVYLARAATVVLEKLPAHPQYNSLNAEQKGALKDNGKRMLEELAEMKARINDQHQRWETRPPTRPQTEPPRRPQTEQPRKQDDGRKREEAERIRRLQAEEEEARRTHSQEEGRRQESGSRRQYESPPDGERLRREAAEREKRDALAKSIVEQERERARQLDEQHRRRQEQGQQRDRLRQHEALRQVEAAARQAKAAAEEEDHRLRQRSGSTSSKLPVPSYPTPSSLTSSPPHPQQPSAQPARSPIPYVSAHQDDFLPILPLESPTRTRMPEAYVDDPIGDRRTHTPSRASTRSVARSWSYPPPETTTSPPPPEMRRIEYPQLMNPHQRQQGYIPSSSSMFASQSPPQHETPQALLFQPNGFQPPPPPPHPPSMLYAHTLPTRSSISSLADNYNAMSAYPIAPPPPPPAPPAQFIGFPDARSSSMPEYHAHPRLNNPYNMPPRPPKERISPPKPPQPLAGPKPSGPPDATVTVGLRPVTLPASTLPRFLSIAALNTAQNRETCGLLLGKLRKNTFYVSTLLIPKQTATDDSCTMTDEELVFEFQDKRELLTLGWIHTHPSQSCFMSSLDLHTHAGFQSMLPEAFAIVCAPKHTPKFGIFRLTDPPGLPMIKECKAKEAFHPHPDMPIYTDADNGHVQMKDVELEIIDLR